MNYLTAKFIHSFKSNGLEKILELYLLEEIAKIENLSTLFLDSESDYQLNICVNEDFPKFQQACIKAQNFDIITLSSSLEEQLNILKKNINFIYIHSIENIKKDVTLQEKVFSNKNSNLQSYLGSNHSTSVKPKPDDNYDASTDEAMKNFTGLDFHFSKNLKEQGLSILQEDNLSETWQNKFTSMSERISDKFDKKKMDTPSQLGSPLVSNETGNMLNTGHWVVLAIIASIILSLIFLIIK